MLFEITTFIYHEIIVLSKNPLLSSSQNYRMHARDLKCFAKTKNRLKSKEYGLVRL